MNDMLQAKVDCLAGRTYLVHKNLKTVFFSGKFGITSLWEDLEAKLLTPGQFLE